MSAAASQGSNRQGLKLALAGCLLVGAAILFALQFSKKEQNDLAYFYDVSAQKLFTAPQSHVPPIPGIDNDETDGMRAVVIAPQGKEKDEERRRIVYLEKYSPEFKAQIESMRRDGAAALDRPGRIGRGAAQSHTFVRRLTDTEWYALSTPEGEKIVTEWQLPDANGKLPAVCVP